MALGITENIPTNIATLQVLAVKQTWVTDNITGIHCNIFIHSFIYVFVINLTHFKATAYNKTVLTLIKCNTTNFNYSDTDAIISKGINNYMCIKEKELFVIGGSYSSATFRNI